MERNAFLAGTPLFSGVASRRIDAMLDCLDAAGAAAMPGRAHPTYGGFGVTAGIVLTGASASTASTLGQRERRGHAQARCHVRRRPTPPPASAARGRASPTRTAVLFLNLAKVVGPCSCRCDHHALVARNMIAAIARQSLALSRRIFRSAQVPSAARCSPTSPMRPSAPASTPQFDIPATASSSPTTWGWIAARYPAGCPACRRRGSSMPPQPLQRCLTPSNSTVEK